jgi:hypothetical protein
MAKPEVTPTEQLNSSASIMTGNSSLATEHIDDPCVK